MEVPVLDATAIGVSVFRGNMKTAGSIMFLLGIGETLEEWTHKKSVDDLASSMSLNIDRVWLKRDGQEVLVSSVEIQSGDQVIVHMGNVIPFDVVDAAHAKYLEHEEMHQELEYIVAHGMQEKFDALPEEYSHLYLAVDSVLAAVICIEDPLREEAEAVITTLKRMGIKKSGHDDRGQ